MNSPVRCPKCGHIRHRLSCLQYMPWWKRWFKGIKFCGCLYWDSRWDDKVVSSSYTKVNPAGEYKVYKDPLAMPKERK